MLLIHRYLKPEYSYTAEDIDKDFFYAPCFTSSSFPAMYR